MKKECYVCGSATQQKCSACLKVNYCTVDCQRKDRIRHILECDSPGRPITSADHLAFAVQTKLVPVHPQTITDYGFNSAQTFAEMIQLLAMYADLMEGLGVKPQTLHRWQAKGVLYKEIEKTFEASDEGRKSRNYQWFLGNPQFKRVRGVDVDAMVADAFLRAYHMTGGLSDVQAVDAMHEELIDWSPERLRMWVFYGDVLSAVPPQTGSDAWIHFGFGATNPEDKHLLLEIYSALVMKATHDEFREAYKANRLAALMDQYGFQEKRNRLSLDVLDALNHGPDHNSDVWNLKTYAIWNEKGKSMEWQDRYGLSRCTTEEETSGLKNIYRKFFAQSGRRAFELAEAANAGKIYEFVTEHVRLLPQEKSILKRLTGVVPNSVLHASTPSEKIAPEKEEDPKLLEPSQLDSKPASN
ncbi:hypothetical protein SISNIDRAFT_450611 [Sistotremastrum niveocremeum HHB9708]|uniref:MYND-type domain-containing protein n=1 Tax=Sistotremastrum niveocremeum HHB9708 TaxID=1314777 RepID=A0A164YFM7_9AGAM|nr:hypothetical protein SISNIDRAFT_450611 [Sistotremastrum niveocremeum HHB9708]